MHARAISVSLNSMTLCLLQTSSVSRPVSTRYKYDEAGQVIQTTCDYGEGDGYQPVTVFSSYDADGKLLSARRPNVPVNDPDAATPSLASLPTKPMDITETSYHNAFGKLAMKCKNGIPYECFIYDSGKRKRYHLKLKNGTDYSNIQVSEFRYTATNDRELIIHYATPLKALGTPASPWDDEWFVTKSVQFLSQIGEIQSSSTEDKVTYTHFDNAGSPLHVYKGIDLSNSDIRNDKFGGAVPYYSPSITPAAHSCNNSNRATNGSGRLQLGYALETRVFDAKQRCLSHSRLMDQANSGRYSTTYYWYALNGRVGAKASPRRLAVEDSDKSKSTTPTGVTWAVTRFDYDGLHRQILKYRYAKPMTELSSYTSLDSLVTFLQSQQSPTDRVRVYDFDQRGSLTQVTHKNCVRHLLDEGVDPSAEKYDKVPVLREYQGDVIETRTYNGTGVLQTRSVPRRAPPPGEEGDDIFPHTLYVRDARDKIVAQVNAAIGYEATPIWPLTTHKLDARGNAVQSTKYANGADEDSIRPGQMPKPKDPNPATDPVAITEYTALRQAQIEQDGQGNVKFKTFHPHGKLAREYQSVSLWSSAIHTRARCLGERSEPVVIKFSFDGVCKRVRLRAPVCLHQLKRRVRASFPKLAGQNICIKYRLSDDHKLMPVCSDEALEDARIAFADVCRVPLFLVLAVSTSKIAEPLPLPSKTTVIDEMRYERDLWGRLHSKASYRDGHAQETMLQTYDMFDRVTGEGDSQAKALQLYKVYDVLDNLRSSNAIKKRGRQGVAAVYQFDLSGNMTQEIVSSSDDLSTIRTSTLKDLDSVNDMTAVEVTTNTVGEGPGAVLMSKFPSTTVGYSKDPTPIPVLMHCNIFPSEFTTSTPNPVICWPDLKMLNTEMTITVTPTPPSSPLQPNLVGACWQLDASDWTSGIYSYTIEHSRKNPLKPEADPTIMFKATGQIPVVSSKAAAQGVIIPYVLNGSALYFAGDTTVLTAAAAVQLVGSDKAVKGPFNLTTDSNTHHKTVQLASPLPSGTYQPTLLDSSGKTVGPSTLPPVMISTAVIPTSGAETSELPCQMTLTVTNAVDSATLECDLWTHLPPQYKTQNVSWCLRYTSTDGVSVKEKRSLSPSSTGTRTFGMSHAVKSLDHVSIVLPLDTTTSLQLYGQTDKNLSLKSTSAASLVYEAKPKRFAVIRGPDFCNLTDKFTITYWDKSKGQASSWVNLPAVGAPLGAYGVAFDVSGMQPGVYPFIKPGGDFSDIKYHLVLTHGSLLGTSTSGLTAHTTGEGTQPKRFYEHDLFRNLTLTQDAEGNVTQYTYNDKNKKTSKIDPVVSTYNPGEVVLTQAHPVTRWFYDFNNKPIAKQMPLQNFEYYPRDNAGNVLQIIQERTAVDGDTVSGSILIKHEFNGLSLPISYSTHGQSYTVTYDLNGKPLTRTEPGYDPDKPIQTRRGYDEKSRLNQVVDGMGYTSLYNYGFPGKDVITYIDPNGKIWSYTYYKGFKTSQTRPDSKVQTWSGSSDLYRYCGVMDLHTDLGGTKINKTFNNKLQYTRKYVQPGNIASKSRGQFANLAVSCGGDGRLYYSFDKPGPQKCQDQSFSWSADQLITLTDNTMGYTTRYDYDYEGRCIYTCMIRSDESHSVIHEARTELDALGRASTVVDSVMSGLFVYDLNGNRLRSVIAKAGKLDAGTDQWNTFDRADCTLINGGQIGAGNKIVLGPGCGWEIKYDATSGYRLAETAAAAFGNDVRTYTYYNHGDVKSVSNVFADPNTANTATSFQYNDACDVIKQTDSKSTSTFQYDGNGNVTNSVSGKQKTTYYYDNNCNEMNRQYIDAGDGNNLTIDFSLGYFGDNSVILGETVDTHDGNGNACTRSTICYDANGAMNAKFGTDKG